MCNIVIALNLALPVLLSYCYLAQFKRRISHVPNLTKEMTACEMHARSESIKFDTYKFKYDFAESTTETVKDSALVRHLIQTTSHFTCAEYNALIVETIFNIGLQVV